MNPVTKKAALVSTLLLLAFGFAFAAVPALAADPSFTVTGTPNKSGYTLNEQATVATLLSYNNLAAAKYIDMKLYNGTGHYEGKLGTIKAVAGTAGYSNSTTYNMPLNATNKVSTKTYTLKSVENTTNIVVAQATITIVTQTVSYVLSVAWLDSSGDRIIKASESVIFTLYLTYSLLSTTQAVTILATIDAGTPITVATGNIHTGSGTNTTTYSYSFATEGQHSIEFQYVNATQKVIASQTLQLTVGEPAASGQGSITDIITANAIPIAFGFGVAIVLLLFYMARRMKGKR